MSDNQTRGCCGNDNEQLTDLQKKDLAIQDLLDLVDKQDAHLTTICTEAPFAGTVFEVGKDIDPTAFTADERVWVMDPNHEKKGKLGTIVKTPDKNGLIGVKFPGDEKAYSLKIGIKDDMPQVKMLLKKDGSELSVWADGKLLDVWFPYHLWKNRKSVKVGDTVKVHPKSKQIITIEPPIKVGPHFSISRIIDEHYIDVTDQNATRTVRHIFNKEDMEIGDKVVLDFHGAVAIAHVSSKESREFKLRANAALSVNWNDIGGAVEAKQELIDAIETPYTNKEIYSFYGCSPPKGILLWGPPGCGKTMCGKAVSASIAKIFGKDAVESGFNYIKGPEILSMWVGQQEATTRKLFERSRSHYEKHKYPSVTFIDEADSFLSSRRNSEVTPEWHNSLVAMWLAEMDGHDQHNGIFIFATNRPLVLDAALVRDGRIDKHIKVPRPDMLGAQEIFKLYLKNVPLYQADARELAAFLVADIFDNKRPIAEVHFDLDQNKKFRKSETMFLKDIISGAMIKGIVDTARSNAMRRDIQKSKGVGVTKNDFREAVETIYQRHRKSNHDFDAIDLLHETDGFDEHAFRVTPISISEK